MKNKMTRSIILASVGSLICVGIWCFMSFFRYQSNIQNQMLLMSPEERDLPINVSSVFARIKISETDTSGYSRLLATCRGTEGMRPLEISAHRFTWQFLLPFIANESERFSLYAYLMPFDGGNGLKYGASRYFSKNIDQLSDDEVVRLIVISRAPKYFSETGHEAELEEGVETLRRAYQSPL